MSVLNYKVVYIAVHKLKQDSTNLQICSYHYHIDHMTNHMIVLNFCDCCLKKGGGEGGIYSKKGVHFKFGQYKGCFNTVDSFWMRTHQVSSK